SSCCGTNPTFVLTDAGIRKLSCPKTSTVPALAGVKPRISSSKVVLPAPFLPSTPTTSPGSISNERSARTVLRLKDLLRPRATTCGPVIVLLPLGFERFDDIVDADLELLRREHERVELRVELLHSRGKRRLRVALLGNGHRLPAVALEDTFGLEQRVDLRDRHRIDRVLERELSNRRQLGPRRELPARDHAADLLEQLPIDRHTGMRLQRKHLAPLCITLVMHMPGRLSTAC